MLLVSSYILKVLCIYHVIVLVIVFKLSLPADYTTIQNGHVLSNFTHLCVYFLLLPVFDILCRLNYVE